MTRILTMTLAVLLTVLLLPATRSIAGTVGAPDDPDVPASIDFDEVARAATAIPYEFQRREFLFEIGFVRAKAGDRAASQTLFRQGTEQYRKAIDALKNEGSKGYLEVHLAALQSRAGDRASAKETFARAVAASKTITEEKKRADLLQFTARMQAQMGDVAGASDTMRGLLSSNMNIFVLEDIAMAQARAGDVAGVLRTATMVRALGGRAKTRQDAEPVVVACYELVHAEMLAAIALAQAKSRVPDTADARKLIQEAFSLVNRSLALRPDVGATTLVTIALAQVELGEVAQSRETFQRALQVAEGVEGFQSPELMAQIAEARWKTGDTAEARAILRKAFERSKASRPLINQFPQVNSIITQVQLEVGDLDGALQTARMSLDDKGELILHADLVRQLVRAHSAAIGPRAALAEWLKSARSPVLRAYALLGAAEAAATATIPKPPVQP